ncbi:hypothetical protein BBJ28_00026700, partial [Nothophytophthora sp. Chile5]
SLEQNGVELDTFVSCKSWDVAAGTVCLAMDRVVRKEFHNAVCLVRPPGHHEGSHGRTEHAPSLDFCLLNDVVIGATHARLYPHSTSKSCETSDLINVALENKVLPAMKAFGPDTVLISAGLDGLPGTQGDETSSLAKSVAAHVAAISAYEETRRLATDSSSATVEGEIEEEEEADKASAAATEASQHAVVKAEWAAPIKTEPVDVGVTAETAAGHGDRRRQRDHHRRR